MSLQEETYRLGDELQRLDDRLDDLADKLVDADDDSASGAKLAREANSVESQLRGVEYLIGEHGEDATITIRGLDAGEYGRVQDRAEAHRVQSDAPGGVPGARRNIFAAMGLVSAPFFGPVEDVDEDDDALDVALEALASQPVGVAEYVESKANDLTSLTQGNCKPLSERLADRSAN